MASVHIRTRVTKNGLRYDVRYRLGGRATPVNHGGCFKTLEAAEAMRTRIRQVIAGGAQPPAATPMEKREQFVYIAALGDLIKIGVSIAPERRAKDLNAELLAVMPGGRRHERSLHDRFASLRVTGEWFRRDDAILRYAKAAA